MATQATCTCGCGTRISRGRWVPGHDHRAVHQRIRRDHGDVAAFIIWYDQNRPARRTRTRAAA